jgi:hypothetical protein
MGTKRKNPSSRGVPDNLKTLAKRGFRIRFNGFWLNDSERDRAVAQWLDQTPGSAAIIKDLIFRYITGQLAVGFYAAPPQDEYPDEPEIGDAGNAILRMED